ncbi:MAG: DUF2461 domain-containing protein [Bacteroidales bacterium]|nr:DUF2461 domain-containing protein [Bacteroidales bacterium]
MNQIQKSTIQFLSDLKNHNDRDWFAQNRARYNEARTNYELFVQAVIDEISTFDPILRGLEVKSCTYRINRDIRFSNDKTLYKSHLGAFITRGGKKNGDKYAGYYFHIEPGKSIICGGAYMPPTPWLSAIREKIDEKPEEFLKIINSKDFIRYFRELDGEKLKKAPKGYPSDHPYLDLIKYKSYLVVNEVSDNDVLKPDFFDHVIKVSKAMKPLNDFLNEY